MGPSGSGARASAAVAASASAAVAAGDTSAAAEDLRRTAPPRTEPAAAGPSAAGHIAACMPPRQSSVERPAVLGRGMHLALELPAAVAAAAADHLRPEEPSSCYCPP